MTFSSLLSNVYGRTGFASSPASDVVTRIKASVNRWHRALLTKPGMTKLRDEVTTFASVNGTARYALPAAIARINRMWDGTNEWGLIPQSLDWYRTYYPNPQSGTPIHYIPIGQSAVAAQPSAATALWIVSTQGADTGTVTIEGVRTGGFPSGTKTLALTGTTAVQIGTFSDYETVARFHLSATQTGVVSLMTAASGGTTLAQIPIGKTFSRYYAFYLHDTPSAAVTYTVDYTRAIEDLTADNDEPLLPVDFHDVLEEAAVADEYLKQEDPRYDAVAAQREQRVKELKAWVFTRPDELHVIGQAPAAPSRLGAWYPSARF